MQRLRLSFSKEKHTKVNRLAKCNQELSEILGCRNPHLKPIAEPPITKRSSIDPKDLDAEDLDPILLFEKIRQNGSAIFNALRRHIRCSMGACENHRICLGIRADVKSIARSPNLEFLFCFKQRGRDPPPAEYIRIERTSAPKDRVFDDCTELINASTASLVLDHSDMEVDASTGAEFRKAAKHMLDTLPDLPCMQKTSLNVFKNKRVKWRAAFGRSISSTSSETPVNGGTTTPICLNSLGNTPPIPEIPEINIENISLSSKPSENIDICTIIHNSRTRGELAVIVDDFDRCFKVINATTQKRRAELPDMISLPKLVSLHESLRGDDKDFRIDREHRLNMAAHISTMLLQAHISPWLSRDWSRGDIYFLTTHMNVYSNLPYLISNLLPQPPNESPSFKNMEEGLSVEDLEDIARDSLRTLGIIITELILGRDICSTRRLDSTPRRLKFQYSVPEHQAVIPYARKWEEEVLKKAGPELEDVVRRCFHCAFGPNPNLRDRRFRQAVYASVIRPLEEASISSLWPETFV